jgi:hypothetical protein
MELAEVTKEALEAGINVCGVGVPLNEIGRAIEFVPFPLPARQRVSSFTALFLLRSLSSIISDSADPFERASPTVSCA